jgi:hypothetical protein
MIRHQIVQDLEDKLTSKLNVPPGASEQQRLAAVSSTFDEVIQEDTHFASLLSKIKGAYSEYLEVIQGKSAR